MSKAATPPSHAMDLRALQVTLRQFAAEREWQPFHTPKNLATALMVEAAELAEVFQWLTPEQSVALRHDAVARDQIGDEVADVLLYLLQLADHCDVDLKRAVGRKLVKNSRKHPPKRPGAPAGPTAAVEIETHVLLDYENVQPTEDELRALVPDMSELWLFHGPHQKGLADRFASLGERVMRVPIEQRGKNSLDFHLSFYLGYVASRYPDARLVVVANDRGYEPMIGHAKELGFAAAQIGFSRAASKSPRTPRKTAVKKSQTTAAAPKKTVPKAAARTAAKTAAKTVAARTAAAKPAAGETAKARAPAAKKSAAGKVAAKTGAEKIAPAGAVASPKKRSSSRKPAAAAAPAPKRVQAGGARSPGGDETARLVEVLRRMGSRSLPPKLLRLRRYLASVLGTPAEGDAVSAAINRLLAAGAIEVEPGNAVTYHL